MRVPAGVPSGARIKVEVPAGPPAAPEERVKVRSDDAVKPHGAALTAGSTAQVGSRIIAVNGEAVTRKEDIVNAIARSELQASTRQAII